MFVPERAEEHLNQAVDLQGLTRHSRMPELPEVERARKAIYRGTVGMIIIDAASAVDPIVFGSEAVALRFVGVDPSCTLAIVAQSSFSQMLSNTERCSM